MRTFRGAWSLAGLVTGATGLAVSYCLAMVLAIRESPVVAVAELVIRLTPGALAERAIQLLGAWDKPVLVATILVLSALIFAWAGRLAARSRWAPALVFVALAALGGAAVAVQRGVGPFDVVPVVAGLVTWLVVLPILTAPLRRVSPDGSAEQPDDAAGRRAFLVGASATAGVALALGALGRFADRGRRRVEESRRLLRLTGVTQPMVPDRARIGLDGVSAWMTPNDDFYRIHTAIVVPAIDPSDWSLRIHGLVDREITLTYEELVAREIIERWVTLNCVSNPVGGPLIGNAWWSGVRLGDLLAEAGPHPDADAVLQTSDDGWTCATPLSALTDVRDAMLAVSMNGEPLPIEHGFPARTIVPGLYGYVSACKWVVDLEVGRFDTLAGYWTGHGWSERGPVKLSSRIDVPRSGDEVVAGAVAVGGVAWAQSVGIAAVEVSLDGGAWQRAEIANPPTNDTWVQWAATLEAGAGDHLLRVRATDKRGLVQTGVERDVLPDGSTGWHTIAFSAVAR